MATIAGQAVVEVVAGGFRGGTTPTAGFSAIEGPSGVLILLDSTSLIVGSVPTPIKKHSFSASLPRSFTGGMSSQGLGTTNGIITPEIDTSSSPKAFTGRSERRKPNFSMVISLPIVAWIVYCTL